MFHILSYNLSIQTPEQSTGLAAQLPKHWQFDTYIAKKISPYCLIILYMS